MNLLILGMHRSGTSVLGRIITRLGFYPGPEEQLMPPLEENPTGFWERRDIRDINDKILRLHESSWDCPTKNFPTRSKLPKELSHDIATILSRMESQYPYFVKDPRISLTGNYWFSKYSKFLPILAIRNPIEVAQSLKKRNSLPLELGLALWEKYTISALRVLGRKKYYIYDYNSFISNPKATINSLLNEFERLNIQINSVSIEELTSLVDIRLKRNNYRKGVHDPYKYYTDLYENIIAREPIKAPSRELSFRSANVLDLYKTVKKIDLEKDLTSRLDKSNKDLVSLKSEYETANSDRSNLTQKVRELSEQNEALSERCNHSEKSKINLEKQLSDLRTKLDDSLAEQNALLNRVTEVSETIEIVEQDKTKLLEETSIQTQQLDETNKEKERLKGHIEQLAQSLEQSSGDRGLLEIRNAEISQSLEKAVEGKERLEARNEEISQSLEKAVENNRQLEACNKKLNQSLNESNQRSDHIQKSCDQLNKQIEADSKRYKELEKNYLDSSEKLNQQSIEIENLNSENRLLSADLSKLDKIVEEGVRKLSDLKLENQSLTDRHLNSSNELLELRLRLHTLKLLNEQLYKIDSFHRSSIESYLNQIDSIERKHLQANNYINKLSEENINQENENRFLRNQILYNEIERKINGNGFRDSKLLDDSIDLSEFDTLKQELLSAFTNSYDDFNSLRTFFDSMVTSFLESHIVVYKLNKRIDNLIIEKDNLFLDLKKTEVTNQKLNQDFSEQTATIRSLEIKYHEALDQAKFEHNKVKAMQDKFYNGKMIHLYYFSRNIFRLKQK